VQRYIFKRPPGEKSNSARIVYETGCLPVEFSQKRQKRAKMCLENKSIFKMAAWRLVCFDIARGTGAENE
jgi:hypothetical protein